MAAYHYARMLTVVGRHPRAEAVAAVLRARVEELKKLGTDDSLFHRGRMFIAEPRDLIGDHHGAGQVDVPRGERSAGQGQAAQRDGQAENLVRSPPG